MRLDYVPNPPTDLSPEDQEVLERVKARRGSMGLIPLDLTLLHAPKIADGEYNLRRRSSPQRLINTPNSSIKTSPSRLERPPRRRTHQELAAR